MKKLIVVLMLLISGCSSTSVLDEEWKEISVDEKIELCSAYNDLGLDTITVLLIIEEELEKDPTVVDSPTVEEMLDFFEEKCR
ncbi:MAG: hypothetical protein ACREOB_07840 [Thermodesulfobacteriota bacterium]